jgi:hypothetical protein
VLIVQLNVNKPPPPQKEKLKEATNHDPRHAPPSSPGQVCGRCPLAALRHAPCSPGKHRENRDERRATGRIWRCTLRKQAWASTRCPPPADATKTAPGR